MAAAGVCRVLATINEITRSDWVVQYSIRELNKLLGRNWTKESMQKKEYEKSVPFFICCLGEVNLCQQVNN